MSLFQWGADLSLLGMMRWEAGLRIRFYGLTFPGTNVGIGIVRRTKQTHAVRPAELPNILPVFTRGCDDSVARTEPRLEYRDRVPVYYAVWGAGEFETFVRANEIDWESVAALQKRGA